MYIHGIGQSPFSQVEIAALFQPSKLFLRILRYNALMIQARIHSIQAFINIHNLKKVIHISNEPVMI